MKKHELTVTKNYLVFPVNHKANPTKTAIYKDGVLVFDFDLRLDCENPENRVYYDVKEYKGKTLEIVIMSDADFSLITSDEKTAIPYVEERPIYHFTAPFGWINDPNGLVEYKSKITNERTYHMFYQYNPYDILWGNMHWGHATSSDLIHWQNKDIALFPDDFGTMFSGSAIIDKENRSGLKNGDEDVMLLFYTAAGNHSLLSKDKQFTQCLAYSQDGGKTFIKYNKNPIIEHIRSSNRDPKVIFCDELGCNIMALYLDKCNYLLLKSDNLTEWNAFQEITIENCSECPDIYPLNTIGKSSDRKWIISGATGAYVVCECKDGRFNIIQSTKSLFYGKHAYASQTFSDTLDNRRIQISWDRDLTFPGNVFVGQLGIPCEMSLITYENEYRLCAKPIAELLQSLKPIFEKSNVLISEENNLRVNIDKGAYAIELDLNSAEQLTVLTLSIFGCSISIDCDKRIITANDLSCPLSDSVSIYTDSCSTEIFSENGTALMTVPFVCNFGIPEFSLSSSGMCTLKHIKLSRFEIAFER